MLVNPEGEAKLSDLGLAGPLDEDEVESDPRYGKIVGTADYLSPDHITSPWEPTPAWDIYSLGCTLYYAVTGKVPFPGGTTADKVRAHCELRPLDPRRLNPGLSSEFVDVMADMMAKEPAQRIPSATDVVRRLAPWARGAGAVRPAGFPPGGGVTPLPSAALPTLPVVPPPVVGPALGAGNRPSLAVRRLSDTVADFHVPAGAVSNSDESPSLIVSTNPRPFPLQPQALLLLALTPVALGLLALLGYGVWRLLF